MNKKKLIIGILVLVLALFLAVKFAESYAEQRFSNRIIPIKDLVNVQIGEIRLSLWEGGIVVKDVQLVDTLNPAATGSVEKVVVQGIRWIDLILEGKFSAQTVKIEGANCELKLNRLKTDTTGITPIDTIDKLLSFSAPLVSVSFDKEMHPEVSEVDIKSIKFRPGQGKYDIDLGRITSSDKLKVIEIDSFHLIPRYPKLEFGFRAGRRMGSIDLLLPRILVHDFDIHALTKDSLLAIQSVVVHGGDINVFSDKRVPIGMDHYGPLPVEALLDASQRIAIDSVIVKDFNVNYASINPNSMKEGYLEFRRSYVNIYNITNVPELIEEQSSMVVDILQSHFTNEGELKAQFDFPLNREDYQFKWHGTLGKMKLDNLDSFVLPIVNMDITHGYCHGLTFDIVSDYHTSTGTLEFQYVDLKIMALDIERKKKRKFLSGMANTFIVHSNNLIGDKNYFKGTVDFDRVMYRGFPDYVWKSLESGIMSIILPKAVVNTIEKQGTKSNDKKSKKKK